MMKNLHQSLLFTFLLLLGISVSGSAQTTVTTGLPSSAGSGSGSNYFITFVVVNNNSYGINITDIAMYRASTSNGNTYTVYYSSSSLSGNPSTSTTLSSPTWLPVTSAVLSTVSTTAIHPTFSNVNFTIPANTTYRFAVQTNATSLNYGASATTPNSFTNGGVTIGNGNYQINSLNVGYWGPSTNPRFWCGSITFVPAGPPCFAPSGATASGITMTTANFNWNAVTGSLGYEYQITTSSTAPTTAGTPTLATSHNATGLSNGVNYWFWVRNKCSTAVFSNWTMVPFTTSACPSIPLANVTVSNISTVGANINWTAVTGSLGYEYSFGTNAAPPASGTPQSTTSYNATGLNPGTTYYFHVRNKCTSPSNSAWTTKSFVTLPCPSAGTPVITNNVPGSVTFTWPGSSTAGVVGYQWAVTGSAAVPSSWNNTNNLTATLNTLISGSTYYIHVRTDCNSSKATYTPLMFVNPFPPCATPATLTISEVNMHGANIKWTSSANVSNGYQYALTTSATPPTTGLTLTSDTAITVVNLVGGQKYYFYVRTHCGANTANPPVLNLSGWKIDSFTTPLSCLSTITTNITNVTTNSADIEWTNYPGIYGYEYVINSNATAPPASFSGAAITFHTLAAAGLLSGTNYYFHIRVRCDTFNFSPWATTPFNTQSICNSAPSSPTLTSITPTTANFSWAGVPGAQQYQYSVTTSNTPNPNSNTYTSQTTSKVLSLMPNTPYWFHVRAYCSPSDLSGWESVPFSTVSVSVNSIGTGDGYNVVAYPNPVKDLLQIEVGGEMKGKASAVLYDLSGKVLRQIELKDAAATLDMSGLAQGMYLLRYIDEERTSAIRIQKQ